ncbi:hypothetical protein [Candidatus Blastococcus massiliensis]|uniref:hypothetical protein n=1 Tax=Candidatus Blastococcus massiliensis TaxID=1470358 RepID=UPI0004BABE01|nr:hypothetical protein [Candidatus Blastococcus massiliensis]
MTSRIVLVRGTRSAAPAGGGCCGGDVRPFDEGGSHCHPPPRDEVGEVYRALRSAFPHPVDIQVVAPSNWLWLLPELIRGGRRRGMRGIALYRSVRAGMAVSSVLVDGVVVISGGLPAPTDVVRLVGQEPALRRALPR